MPVLAMVASLAAIAAFAFLALTAPRSDQAAATGLLVFPLLLAGAVALTGPAARAETRFDLRSIMVSGFALRGVGTVLRYSQPVDALVYHQEGVRIAAHIRAFDLFPDVGRQIPGTGSIRYVSGVVHVGVFDDMMTAFLVFTCLSFFGSYLCYRAFTYAVPAGNHRKYALLVFLWPSLLYWPSSIGKEAWMVFGLGIVSWGVSRVLTAHAAVGLPVVAFGLIVMVLVRPHVALMAIVGLSAAMLAKPGGTKGAGRWIGRILTLALLVVAALITVAKTGELLKTDNLGTDSISSVLDTTVTQTDQGGSSFTPHLVHSPLDYPVAFATVWFRPFVTDAKSGGASQLASIAENLFLLGLVAGSWRQLRYLPRALVRVPYVTYAFVYSLVFVYAFAAIGNFGILARQRTQGTILLFVVLCLPPLKRTSLRDNARIETGGGSRSVKSAPLDEVPSQDSIAHKPRTRSAARSLAHLGRTSPR